MSMIHNTVLIALSDFMMRTNNQYRFEIGVRIVDATVIPPQLRAAYKQQKRDTAMFVLDSRAPILETSADETGFTLTTTFGGALFECFFPTDSIMYVKDAYDDTGIAFGGRSNEVIVRPESAYTPAESPQKQVSTESKATPARPELKLVASNPDVVRTPPTGELRLIKTDDEK